MSRYLERVEALEHNEKRKKALFSVIIVLLVLIFLFGMVLGAQNVLRTEAAFDPNAETATAPVPLGLTAEELINRFAAVQNASGNPDAVKISVYTDVEIPDESLEISSGDENLKKELLYLKPKVLESLKAYYKIYEGKFGEDFSGRVLPVTFTAKDVTEASAVRGKLSDEGTFTEGETVFTTLRFPETAFDTAEQSVLFRSFGMGVSRGILDTFRKDIAEIATVEDLRITCNDFSITSEADRETGNLKNIWYNRGYRVTLTLTFRGDLAALGSEEISFDFYAKESHWYTYAGLRFKEHALKLEKGDVKPLEAFKTADEEVKVTWTSSDPERVSVDEAGYLKGKVVSPEPVTITATFTYRSRTYTDSCSVLVRKPAEEIKTTPREVTLSPGETAALTAQIKPANATVQEVLWFTEDASVAAVSPDGTVTAGKPGVTKVFAVAADGNFRSSCIVTVTQ